MMTKEEAKAKYCNCLQLKTKCLYCCFMYILNEGKQYFTNFG